jgi:hypothetical protein
MTRRARSLDYTWCAHNTKPYHLECAPPAWSYQRVGYPSTAPDSDCAGCHQPLSGAPAEGRPILGAPSVDVKEAA